MRLFLFCSGGWRINIWLQGFLSFGKVRTCSWFWASSFYCRWCIFHPYGRSLFPYDAQLLRILCSTRPRLVTVCCRLTLCLGCWRCFPGVLCWAGFVAWVLWRSSWAQVFAGSKPFDWSGCDLSCSLVAANLLAVQCAALGKLRSRIC